MTNLIGTYECKIDTKGRVMLPTVLKKQLSAVLENGFVLKRAVFQPCLELYPMEEWNELMQKVNKLNRFNKKNNDFVRRFTAGVKLIELDSSGRLLEASPFLLYQFYTRMSLLNLSLKWLLFYYCQRYKEIYHILPQIPTLLINFISNTQKPFKYKILSMLKTI
jgi:MraZ protein